MPKDINYLFDLVIGTKGLKNDSALSSLLEVTPPVVSKLRHHRIEAGPSIILALIERGNLTLEEIRAVIPRMTIEERDRV